MDKKVTRRKFMKISVIGLGTVGVAAAIGKIIALPPDMHLPNPYPVLPKGKPVVPQRGVNVHFFDEHQYAMVATIASLIIPTDQAPGATEAGVVDYIDTLVSQSPRKQSAYREGLIFIDEAGRDKYGKTFLNLEIKEQIELLQLLYETSSMRRRNTSNMRELIDRKIDKIWDNIFGFGDKAEFFNEIRKDTFYGYYANPISWKVVQYFGPPQPVGYLDYADPPSSENYTGTIRTVDDKTCRICHFKQTEKVSHKNRIHCTQCHPSHFDSL